MIAPYRLLCKIVVLAAAGCSRAPAEFPTITERPEEPVPKTRPEEPKSLTLEVGRELSSWERVVRRFFLALRTGDAETLRRLLSPSAVLMKAGSPNGRGLASRELARFTASTKSDSAGLPLVPGGIQIVTMEEQGDGTVSAWVAVEGPEPTKGIWKLRLTGEEDKIVIFELLVPDQP